MLNILFDGILYGVKNFNKPSEFFVDNVGELIEWSDKFNIRVPSVCKDYYDFHKGALSTKEDVEIANTEFLTSAKSMMIRNLGTAFMFALLGVLLAIQVIMDNGALPSILRSLDIYSIVICIYLALKYYRSRNIVKYLLRHQLFSVGSLFLISAEAKAYVFVLTKIVGVDR